MITTFKFCARAIFSLLEKTHTPGSQNLSSKESIYIKNRYARRTCIWAKEFHGYYEKKS